MICNCTSQDIKAITQWSGQLFLYFVLNLACGNNTKWLSLSYSLGGNVVIVTEPQVLFLCIPCVYTYYLKNACISPSYSKSFSTIIVKGEFLPKFLEIHWHLKNHHLILRESSLFNFLQMMLLLDMQYMEWQVSVLRVHNICWCISNVAYALFLYLIPSC